MEEFDVHEDSPDLNARLKGDILGTMSTWEAEYGLVRLELAWTVAQMLLRHVNRAQGLALYIEFAEKLGASLTEEAAELRKVISEDVRRRAH